jgi:hypothetical protein
MNMITVYEIKPNGYIGASKQINPKDGIGMGWTYSAPPGDGPHEWVNGDWQPRDREPEPFTPGPDLDAMAASIRQERTEKLASCDWTQVADAPVDREAWAAYRQALRDITAQEFFPMSVDWPSIPN